MTVNAKRVHTNLRQYKSVDSLMAAARKECGGKSIDFDQEVYVYKIGAGISLHLTKKQNEALTVMVGSSEYLVHDAALGEYLPASGRWEVKPYRWEISRNPDQHEADHLVRCADLHLCNEVMEHENFYEELYSWMSSNACSILEEHDLDTSCIDGEYTPTDFEAYQNAGYTHQAVEELREELEEEELEEKRVQLNELIGKLDSALEGGRECFYDVLQLFEVNGQRLALPIFEFEDKEYWPRGCYGQSKQLDPEFYIPARKKLEDGYPWIIWPWMSGFKKGETA